MTKSPSEHIKVREIQQLDDRTLGITWSDGHSQVFDVVSLRRACPCASCVDEWTKEKRLKPEDISDTVRPVRIESVGSYALKISFSDGHNTGIYSFSSLYKAKIS